MRDEELKSFPWRSWQFNIVIDSLGVLAVQFRIGFIGVYRRVSAAKLVLELIRVYLRLSAARFLVLSFLASLAVRGLSVWVLSPEKPC
jgi:hypothetical protein